MAAVDSDVGKLDGGMLRAMNYWLTRMDEFTGGAFKRGWREMTPAEQIQEFDSLTPEQIATAKANKGDEWFFKYAAQIEKMRAEVRVV